MAEDAFLELIVQLIDEAGVEAGFETDLGELGWDSLCLLGLIGGLSARGFPEPNVGKLEAARTVADLYAACFGGMVE